MQWELHKGRVLDKLGKLLRLPAAVVEALKRCLDPNPANRPDLQQLQDLELSDPAYTGLDEWDRDEVERTATTVLRVDTMCDDGWSDDEVDDE